MHTHTLSGVVGSSIVFSCLDTVKIMHAFLPTNVTAFLSFEGRSPINALAFERLKGTIFNSLAA